MGGLFMTVIGKIYGDAGLRDLLIGNWNWNWNALFHVEGKVEEVSQLKERLKKYYVESTTIMQCLSIYVFTKVYTVQRSTHLKTGLP